MTSSLSIINPQSEWWDSRSQENFGSGKRPGVSRHPFTVGLALNRCQDQWQSLNYEKSFGQDVLISPFREIAKQRSELVKGLCSGSDLSGHLDQFIVRLTYLLMLAR